MVTLVQEPIFRAGRKLSEINKGDRARKDDMSGVCSSTVADQRKSEHPKRNSVTFNPEVTVHLIPYEDRKSEWVRERLTDVISRDEFNYLKNHLLHCYL